MNKRAKSRIVLMLIILPLFLMSMTTPIVKAYTVPNSDSDSSPIYILTGDLIKDTQFTSIGATPIGPGGSAFDNKLKFEISNLWKLERDDIELIYTHAVGNKVYLYYKIPLTADINIYTNNRYASVCEKQVQAVGTYQVFEYHHYGCFGMNPSDEIGAPGFKASINSYSWDFGNVRDWNSKHNVYSGVVKIDFNIKQSPFPDSLTDENGNKLTKDFADVGVSSAIVVSSDNGFMSQATPDIQYSVPQTDKSQEQKSVDPNPSVPSSVQTGNTYQWDARPTIIDAGYDTIDNGIQVPSDGSSLNPTRKDGGPIYDAKANGTSQEDCSLYYNLGSISPVITQYYGRLNYHTLKVLSQDYLDRLTWKLRDTVTQTDPTIKLTTAIQVSNRYAHSQIQVVLNVWSAYEIEVLDTATSEDYNLEKPIEYYDNLTWSTMVDGSATGEVTQPTAGGLDFDGLTEGLNGLLDILGQALIYVIIIVIIAVAIYISYKVLIVKRSTEYVATRVIRG
jgi:hypothetical protein